MIEIPQNYPGKQEGDKVVLFVHKHWIKYVVLFIVSVLLFSIPFVIAIIYFLNKATIGPLDVEILTAGTGIYLLIVMSMIIQAFVDFYLDMLIVTEDRVIFVRQNGYFDQQIDEAHMRNIDEICVDIKGLINSSLGCGDVIIHMGNDEAILTVDDVQDPNKIAREIMRLSKEHIDKNSDKEKDTENSKDKKEEEQ